MERVQVRTSTWVGTGLDLYKKDVGNLAGAAFFALVVTVVSLGMMAGPMLAGLTWVVLQLSDDRKPKPIALDVFQGFRFFMESFPLVILSGAVFFILWFILTLIPALSLWITLVLLAVFLTLMIFSIFLIVDREEELGTACRQSMALVKSRFFSFLGLAAAAGLIGAAGILACGLGLILTFPITLCILAVAYREVFYGVKAPERVKINAAAGHPAA